MLCNARNSYSRGAAVDGTREPRELRYQFNGSSRQERKERRRVKSASRYDKDKRYPCCVVANDFAEPNALREPRTAVARLCGLP